MPRSLTITVAPCLASSSAWPRPMPWPAPVTRAILPSSSPVMVVSSLGVKTVRYGLSGSSSSTARKVAVHRHPDPELVGLSAFDGRHQPRALVQLDDRRDVGQSVGERAPGRSRTPSNTCRACPSRWPEPGARPHSSSTGRTAADSGAPCRTPHTRRSAAGPRRGRVPVGRAGRIDGRNVCARHRLHHPVNSVGRFSMNACTPSLESCE